MLDFLFFMFGFVEYFMWEVLDIGVGLLGVLDFLFWVSIFLLGFDFLFFDYFMNVDFVGIMYMNNDFGFVMGIGGMF